MPERQCEEIESMVPEVGQRIGPYEILGRLGSGGMGLVYSAWDSRLHRDVAIKLLREEFVTSPMRTRFIGEARAASRLNHPNICTIFDIGEQNGCPYMVMELLRGDTLRGRMQHGPMLIDDILCVASDVADALSVAHVQGIVHRDIKPANVVLVDKPGGRFQSKVLDFGLAKINAGDGLDVKSGLTSSGMTVGTVSYMSPEQARGEVLDNRSDLFSLGVVLYEMATGQLPFVGATSALVFVHLLNEPFQPVRELNSSVPRALEQIISACLQKDKKNRFQSAEELLEALKKVTAGSSSGEKLSWLSRFAAGWKQADTAVQELNRRDDDPEVPDDQQRLGTVPGDSFIRPLKRIRTSTHKPRAVPRTPERVLSEADTVRKSKLESNKRNSSNGPGSASDWPELAPSAASRFRRTTSTSAVTLPPSLQQLTTLQGDESSAAVRHDTDAHSESPSAHRWRMIFGTVLVITAVAASVAVFFARHTSPAATTPTSLVLATIANHTGDSNLSGVVPIGLELALQQSPHVSILRGAQFSSAMAAGGILSDSEPDTVALQRLAKSLGASAFVIGDIASEGSAYVTTLRVLDANSGKRIGECSSTAVTRERLTGAIDSLATNLRSIMSESSESIQNNSVPLSREATADIEALKSYASGEQLEVSGHLFDAMYAFERATTLEPQFTQAHLRLAGIFRRQHAEVSAANAASRARASSATTSIRTRLLAQAVYAIDGQGDYAKAGSLLQQLRNSDAFDSDGLLTLALVQRLQGDFDSSLQTAQAAFHLAPGDSRALESVELALIALNRTDDAAQLVLENPAVAGARPATEVLLNFLHSIPSGPQSTLQATSTDDLDAQSNLASVTDAGGHFHEGLSRWKEIANRAAASPDLASAGTYALAQGALNRALASDCNGASSLLQSAVGLPAGPVALYALGTASGLCGELTSARKSVEALNATHAQAFAVRSFYISDLNALILWKSGLPADALVTLESAKEFDALSFTPYLRGLIYMAQAQPQLANVEFQSMLRRRGPLTLLTPVLSLVAQLGVAHAYAGSGDAANATQAYGVLLSMLPTADNDSALFTEARHLSR